MRSTFSTETRTLENRGLAGVISQHAAAFDRVTEVGIGLCKGDHRFYSDVWVDDSLTYAAILTQLRCLENSGKRIAEHENEKNR